MVLVFGLTGRIAAGKGEVARFLKEEYDASVFRFSDILRDVLEVLALPNNRENLQVLGSGIRNLFGDDVLINAMKKNIAKTSSKIVVVDGVRYLNEVEMIRSFKKNAIIYVDAPLKARYERCVARGTRGESKITLEEFKKSEEKETEKSLDEIKDLADEVIDNTGSIKQLHDKIDSIMQN